MSSHYYVSSETWEVFISRMSISILRLELTTSKRTMEAKPWIRGYFTAAVTTGRIGQSVDAHVLTASWSGTAYQPTLRLPLSRLLGASLP